ncbi:MAG: hypothetical protein PVJ27_01625 [Candidatus Brocadiaceae bacterium]|jgi:hypothetical protein
MAGRVYTLEVCIIEGPMLDDFIRQNPTVSRTIEILDSQTLVELHDAIFEAFDRDDEHMFEFHFGTGPHERDGPRYVLPVMLDVPWDEDDRAAGDLTQTTIDSLDLTVDRAFGYWFDFGDNWYHQINVAAIAEAQPRAKYPRVTGRVGESPPQYVDWDEEE